MEEIGPLVMLAAVATQVTTMLKNLTAGDVRAALTGLVPWVVAAVVLVWGANASYTSDFVLPGLSAPLGDLDVASLLLAAAAVGSSGGLLYSFRTAFDNTDSAAEPALGGGDRPKVP